MALLSAASCAGSVGPGRPGRICRAGIPQRKGGAISSDETKHREVLQLLKDYRTFHTAFGGAMPLDETHVVDAAYGPAGMVASGAAFEERDVPGLRRSYEKLGARPHDAQTSRLSGLDEPGDAAPGGSGRPVGGGRAQEEGRGGALLGEALRGPLRAGPNAAGDAPGEGEALRGLPETDEPALLPTMHASGSPSPPTLTILRGGRTWR
jgi:hypothetical protein